MTVPDAAPTATDVIAEAIHRSDCGCTDWHPKDPEDAMYDQYAAAVVAAIRGMSVQQQADLRPDLTIEVAPFDAQGRQLCVALHLLDDPRRSGNGWHARSRLVSEWRAEP